MKSPVSKKRLRAAGFDSLSVSAAGALILALGCVSGYSQNTPPSKETAKGEGTDEVYTLPSFSVDYKQASDGWVANQAVSGTRTAAPIIELPFNVQVLTNDFLEDFHLVGLTNQMSFFTAYSGGSDLADPAMAGSGQSGNMLRGFPVTINRDGFNSNGIGKPPSTIANTASVENISGPISILYGDVQPGGIINYVTRRPSVRPEYRMSLSTGSYDYRRGNVMASGPLVSDKLYYLAMFDHSHRTSAMQYTYARTNDFLGSLMWKPWKSTSITVGFEAIRLTGRRAATIPHLMINTKVSASNPLSWSGGVDAGIDWSLAKVGYSRFGPTERYVRNYDSVSVLLEHAYNAVWKQRVSYQATWKEFDLSYRTNSNVSAETGRMKSVQPNHRVQTLNAPNNVQTDLLGEFTACGVKQALLFTGNYMVANLRDKQLRLQSTSGLSNDYVYQDPKNPYWPEIDNSQLTKVGSKNYENLSGYGLGFSDRMFLADNRLITLVGARYDYSRFEEDQRTNADQFIPGHDGDMSYSTGANYKLIGEKLVLYSSYSSSFNSNPTVDSVTGTTIPNERGRGLEVGIKSLSPNGKFGSSLALYRNEKTNIGQDNPSYGDGNGEPQYLGSGKNLVRGVDCNVFWRLGEDLTLKAGASYLDGKITSSTNSALVGTRILLVPRMTGSLAATYGFSGMLKGLRLGASLRYTGDYVRAIATSSVLYQEGAARQLADAFVSYRWKYQKTAQTVSVNLNNVFDKFYVGPDQNVGMGRAVNFTYKIEFR